MTLHPALYIIWLQSWNDFCTSIRSATYIRFCRQFTLCTELCACRLHCMHTRYQGKTGFCLTELVTRLSRATACFSSLVFLFYITTGVFDLHRTLLFQNSVKLYSIPHHLLIVFFLQCCQLYFLVSLWHSISFLTVSWIKWSHMHLSFHLKITFLCEEKMKSWHTQKTYTFERKKRKIGFL